jgi:hypothetical protein
MWYTVRIRLRELTSLRIPIGACKERINGVIADKTEFSRYAASNSLATPITNRNLTNDTLERVGGDAERSFRGGDGR